ncbi:MAG TPA: FAD-dependent oxidoreductase [Candidatus Binatia bacterium]|nr:FAD-dependent oxidoreductase [Candidatus Binatia bacterium]
MATRVSNPSRPLDVAVVGGGVAGLVTATLAARSGLRVALWEKAHELGGRAASRTRDGVVFNMGPHALYRAGEGVRVLAELDISTAGGVPGVNGGYALYGGKRHTLPGGLVSLLTTRLFGVPGKLEAARLLGTLARVETAPLASVPLREWLATTVRDPRARRFLGALFRVATYAADEAQSAGAAIEQLRRALAKGVTYLDGGWQTIVDRLGVAAAAAGVEVVTGRRVDAVEPTDGGWRIRLAGGASRAAVAAVVAGAPSDAAAVVHGAVRATLERWAAAARPVRAACLDLALSRLPAPRALFALGVDQRVYLSVHSAVARLAPPGVASVQVAKYLDAERDGDPSADERELEGVLDLVQPGWRDVVLQRRYLPRMVVTNALVTAEAGGLAGRPGPAVAGAEGLYVVGDWVGPEGMLVDASLASARRAALLLARDASARSAAA